MNKIILHIEGLSVLLLSVYVYSYFQFSWGLFFLLLFTPDLSMVGYFINNKVGALLYNLIHTYSLSIGLVLYGFLSANDIVLMVSLILGSHIGMDRMLGFGLKDPTNFKDTHLNRV